MGGIAYWFRKRIHAGTEGITGLETAIILIAFVMVASVFSYVVVSAGLLSSQKAKEAIYAGIETIMSVVEIKGDVIALVEGSQVKEVYLFVGTPAAGGSVDFTDTANGSNTVVISYMDNDQMFPTVNWTMEKLSTVNTDNVLDPAELFLITVDLSSNNIVVAPYERFTLEVKPAGGPVTPVERVIPRRLSQYINLH